MHVCFLINQLAPGGAPTLLLDIVQQTDADDIDYTVCFIEGDDDLVPDFRHAGARVVDFGAAFKFDPRALARMARFFAQEEFDILHTNLPYAQTLGRVFGRLGGQTVISTQHSVAEHYHPITGLLERLTRPLDARTVAISAGVERSFTGAAHGYEPGMDGKWCTIYNGIDVSGFNERVRNADITALTANYGIDDGPVFVSVGRYVPAKSQYDLIMAMESVLTTYPDAQLLLVGWGKCEDDLRAAVHERGLAANVTLTGRVPPADIHCHYALADAFVIASQMEGLGIAGLEAMAAELPVVATTVPGLREIVGDGETGLLVPPNDPDALADAMVAVLQADGYGRRGYERAAEIFDIRTTAAAYRSLYSELTDYHD
ncbi:glycosyltransferase [Halococcus sp. AFM35]|uniref:glycosyltransferase n=1 Tax=Halococcus sp. AFM35 TaxID=3421653 RepID=UPI003EB87DF1